MKELLLLKVYISGKARWFGQINFNITKSLNLILKPLLRFIA